MPNKNFTKFGSFLSGILKTMETCDMKEMHLNLEDFSNCFTQGERRRVLDELMKANTFENVSIDIAYRFSDCDGWIVIIERY